MSDAQLFLQHTFDCLLRDILLVFYHFIHSFFLLAHEITTRLGNYNAEEAINFVLEPGLDFELSGFSEGSDTDDEKEQLGNTRDNDHLTVNPISHKK